jgi:hypothetical protein
MLLTKAELDAIKCGEVSLVFRRWRRAAVKTGGSLRTRVGVLAIERVARWPETIGSDEAGATGRTATCQPNPL